MPHNTKTRISSTVSLPSVESAIRLDQSFVCFDLNLSRAEKAALRKLQVSETSSYDNFDRHDVIETDARRFLESQGNGADLARQGAKTIAQSVQRIMAAMKAEAAWVTLRASVPTDAYDTPRWHQDGYFYAPFEGDQRKAAVTLKGSGTLFKNMPDSLRDAFNKFRGLPPDMEVRKQVDALVGHIPTETVKPGEGAFFVVGSPRGAVHSEPPTHEQRLFLSVVPGSKDQIEELRRDWKRKPTTYTP